VRNGGANQQVSIEDGMGGEGNLEAGVVGQKMQISAKDVVALVVPEIVQEQVQVGGDIGEAFAVDVDKIEANLEKTILMIEKQTNVVPILVLEEENTNEDVELHAEIDGGDILNFLYNLLPHTSCQVGFFWSIFFL
jgi:hypothetical protein